MRELKQDQTQGRIGLLLARVAFSLLLVCSAVNPGYGSPSSSARLEDYEGRLVVSIDLVLENSPADSAIEAEFLSLLKVVAGTEFSAVRVRDSLQALFDSGRVANARVEVTEQGAAKTGPIRLRFVVQRQVQIGDVRLELGPYIGSPISTDELRARLNFVQPGTGLSKQLIARNADEIQVFLRDRGYFNATVEDTEQVDPRGARATVIYKITPGEQARVETFKVNIEGFDSRTVQSTLSLQPNVGFTRDTLGADVAKVRDAIIAGGYLSPILEDAKVTRDPDKNLVSIELKGTKGPKVSVVVNNFELSEKTQRDLIPVKREGNVDYSAIVEGSRRLRNKLQEQGYFFAEVTEKCTVANPPSELGPNGTEETCQNLNPVALAGNSVEIVYDVERGRRFRLTDIRIEGTNKLTFADVEAELKSQKASALGLIPFLGYGRGYTSLTLLEQDKRTIDAFMRDLGYRPRQY
jgi:outer membrane protein assembly factor BamA